jgi:hypothetical protein
METTKTIQLLCTTEEAAVLVQLIPSEYIIEVVEQKYEPLTTIKINNTRGFFTASLMFSMGKTVGSKVASESIMKLIKY